MASLHASRHARRHTGGASRTETDEPRQKRVTDVWNWLPTFRVVAETGQVHAAAKRLNVTPSAVSRTIKLLELHTGGELFERIGRGMRLTALGTSLVGATRSAMRTVDEAFEEKPRLRAASADRITTGYLVPALARLRSAYPELSVRHFATSAKTIEAQLLHGALDVAVIREGLAHPELTVTSLGTATSGVYCGPHHPLFDRRSVTLEELVRHPFAGPLLDTGESAGDGWPTHIARSIRFESAAFDAIASSCESGELLAVLPDHVVATRSGTRQLRRLPCAIVKEVEVYAVSRAPVGAPKRLTEALLAELRAEFVSRPRHAGEKPQRRRRPRAT